jgi:hypothetical protein
VLGMVVFGAVLFALGGIRKEDLSSIPYLGSSLSKIARRLKNVKRR